MEYLLCVGFLAALAFVFGRLIKGKEIVNFSQKAFWASIAIALPFVICGSGVWILAEKDASAVAGVIADPRDLW